MPGTEPSGESVRTTIWMSKFLALLSQEAKVLKIVLLWLHVHHYSFCGQHNDGWPHCQCNLTEWVVISRCVRYDISVRQCGRNKQNCENLIASCSSFSFHAQAQCLIAPVSVKCDWVGCYTFVCATWHFCEAVLVFRCGNLACYSTLSVVQTLCPVCTTKKYWRHPQDPPGSQR